MIRFSDALTLSLTKLKTRRVRLIVTTIVSGLFFVLLAFSSFVFNGTLSSVETFNEDGFGERYITRVDSVSTFDYMMFEDPSVIAEAKAIDKAYIAEKKAAAKKLGVPYDPAMEQLSVFENGPGGSESINPTPQLAPFIRQKDIERSKAYFQSIESAMKEYNVTARYDSVNLTSFGSPFSVSSVPTIYTIKDGIERSSNNQSGNSTGINSISSGLTAMSDPILETFLLPEQQLMVGEDGVIPIIAPYTAAEEVLGIKKLPINASSEARLERLKEVRSNVAGKMFVVCLRNQTSIDRQQLAEQQAVEIEQNKSKKDYVKPELIYEKTNNPCEDVVVTRDVRSAAVKKETTNLEAFESQFGKQSSQQRLVTFKIAGVVSDPPKFGGFSVKSLIGSLLTSNLGQGWFIPLSAQSNLPEYTPLFSNINQINSYEVSTYFEMASAEDAKVFVKEQTCEIDYVLTGDPAAYCLDKGSPFFLSSFGSNSVALTEAKSIFENFFYKAVVVISAISAIIMMGTIGKIIADSRRETAVFRAIGAKRADIAQIYLMYSVFLGLIVASFSIGIGYVLAQYVDSRYAGSLTVDAIIAYNSTNLDRTFGVIGINAKEVFALMAVILLSAIVSAILPLFSNLKRNPIKDMRDER
jgi:ABC-type antimicrobial peptide transport system permease subunit